MSDAKFRERDQRVHDYGHLIARWRKVARGAGLRLRKFAIAGGLPVYCLRTRASLDGGLYASAAIHGDEPAGAEGLLRWAQTDLARLVCDQSLPLLILPCLNPWGLISNMRTDRRGHDLNRSFHRRIAPIPQLMKLVADARFALGLALHEDYDGRGVYLYEIGEAPPDLGRTLLRATTKTLPIDPRRQIEDWSFKNGLLALRILPDDVELHPEALAIFPRHAPRFLTFETPSEFSLAARVEAHAAIVQECIRLLLTARSRTRSMQLDRDPK